MKSTRFPIGRNALLRIIPFVAMCAMFVVLVTVLHRFTVPMLVGDDWALYSRIADVLNGERSLFAMLWEPFGPHRLVFPMLLRFIAAELFRSVLVETLVLHPLYAGVQLLLIGLLLKRTAPSLSQQEQLFLLLPIAACLFSFHFRRAWFFGVFSFYSFTNIFALATILLLTHFHPSWKRIVAAAMSCIVASFSLLHGWLTWFIALPLLYSRSQKKPVPLTLVWLGLFAFSMVFWFLEPNNIFLEISRKTSYSASLPHIVLRIIFIILGHPLTKDTSSTVALFTGMFLTALFAGISIALSRSQRYRTFALPWICLGLYAIGTAVVIGMGRGHVPQRAMVAHYMIPSQLLVIALLVLVSIPLLRYRILLQRSLLLLSTVWLLFLSTTYINNMASLSVKKMQAYHCVQSWEEEPQQCFQHVVSLHSRDTMYSVRDDIIRAGLFPPLRPPNTP